VKYFYLFFLAVPFESIFLSEAAQYESSYRRTAHHATVSETIIFANFLESAGERILEIFGEDIDGQVVSFFLTHRV